MLPAQQLCSCICGEKVGGLNTERTLGTKYDSLYEADLAPIRTAKASEVLSFSMATDQPLRGNPIRYGRLWYLLGDERVELVHVTLHNNGILMHTMNERKAAISLSPFALVRNCRFHDSYVNKEISDLKVFKVSLFAQNLVYHFGVRCEDQAKADAERLLWVSDLVRVVARITQSLFPPFNMCCKPILSVASTFRRLMAGYLIYCEDRGPAATVLYAELHAHSHLDSQAILELYEDEHCEVRAVEICITARTSCSENQGIGCSCFYVEDHRLSARTCLERRLWLRALSNIKVKLQNEAPTPSAEELSVYRRAIEDQLQSTRSTLEEERTAVADLDPLLRRLPRKSASPFLTPRRSSRMSSRGSAATRQVGFSAGNDCNGCGPDEPDSRCPSRIIPEETPPDPGNESRPLVRVSV